MKGLRDIMIRGRAWPANLNERRSWTPRIEIGHSIPCSEVVAPLWAGSQAQQRDAIHDDDQRAPDFVILSRISLDRRRGQFEDIV
jgi:hypothetical protein